MKRGSKEFYQAVESFERDVNSGSLGYISSDFTKDDFSKTTFYENGEVNFAFRVYLSGYSSAKCEFQK